MIFFLADWLAGWLVNRTIFSVYTHLSRITYAHRFSKHHQQQRFAANTTYIQASVICSVCTSIVHSFALPHFRSTCQLQANSVTDTFGTSVCIGKNARERVSTRLQRLFMHAPHKQHIHTHNTQKPLPHTSHFSVHCIYR